MVKGDGSLSGSCELEEEEEDGNPRATTASEERGVELTRLSSEERLAVERKTASADLRSVLLGDASASAFAAFSLVSIDGMDEKR